MHLTNVLRQKRGLRDSAAQVARLRENGFHATIVRRRRLCEFHVTMTPLPGEATTAMIARLHAFLAGQNAVLLRQEVFGMRTSAAEYCKHTALVYRAMTWPLTWVEGDAVDDGTIAGIHAFAVSNTDVRWIFDGGRAVGSVFSDGHAKHCIVGAITPSSEFDPRVEQADEIFDLIERQLTRAKMNWKQVARTWMYIDQILDWYGDFNLVRKGAFDRLEVYSHAMPASTGVGVSNIAGTALVAGAWAVAPLHGQMTVEQVVSPLQCSARDYGSCFSRAVEMDSPDLRRLFISGTASISRDGRTLHVGDIRAQIAETFEVVKAILKSRGMRWNDVSRATAYLKNAHDGPAFKEFLNTNGYNLPVVTTRADVCRDDLLFEIEVDAIVSTARSLNKDWEI